MRVGSISLLVLLAACGSAPQAATPAPPRPVAEAPQPEPPPPAPAYRARVEVEAITIDGARQPVERWTDIVVAGTDERHLRACEQALAAEVDPLFGPRAEVRTARGCALEPLPARPPAGGQHDLLVEEEVRTESAEGGDPVTVAVTTFSPVSTRVACEALRDKLRAYHEQAAAGVNRGVASWLENELRAAEAERDQTCAGRDERAAGRDERCTSAETRIRIIKERLAAQPPPPTYSVACEARR